MGLYFVSMKVKVESYLVNIEGDAYVTHVDG